MRAKETYRLWHNNIANLSRVDRYTLGAKIDEVFLSLLELIFRTSFASDKLEKLSLVSQAIAKADILKFLLQIGWEHKILDHKTYGEIIILLDEIGRMLGGWKKNILEKTSAKG
ncbi:MAG: four helix bundle protein [bacterium]